MDLGTTLVLASKIDTQNDTQNRPISPHRHPLEKWWQKGENSTYVQVGVCKSFIPHKLILYLKYCNTCIFCSSHRICYIDCYGENNKPISLDSFPETCGSFSRSNPLDSHNGNPCASFVAIFYTRTRTVVMNKQAKQHYSLVGWFSQLTKCGFTQPKLETLMLLLDVRGQEVGCR